MWGNILRFLVRTLEVVPKCIYVFYNLLHTPGIVKGAGRIDFNKDVLILQQKVLNKQTCTECENYLSVGPVMVCANGKVICGRCNDHDKHSCPSLYNQIAEKCVFRCVNYYAGCEKLLLFTEAREHEEKCAQTAFKCPFCEYTGNGCQLIRHFEKEHSNYVVNDNFKIVLNEYDFMNLIFFENRHVLCVSVFVEDMFIKIYNLLVTPPGSHMEYFKLRFFVSEFSVEFVTPPILITRNLEHLPSHSDIVESPSKENINCYFQLADAFLLGQGLLMTCLSSDWCMGKIEFIGGEESDLDEKALTINFSEHEKSVTTPQRAVEQLWQKVTLKSQALGGSLKNDINYVINMTPADLRQYISTSLNFMQVCVKCKAHLRVKNNIYFCPEYHMVCKNCSFRKCSKCKSFSQWSNQSKWHDISLECDWKHCTQRINIFEYLVHKQQCQFRQYKCPDKKCHYAAYLDDFKRHWHLTPLNCYHRVTIFGNEEAFYWLIPHYNEIVYVTVESRFASNVRIMINEEGTVLRNAYALRLICRVNGVEEIVQNDFGRSPNVGKSVKRKAGGYFILETIPN